MAVVPLDKQISALQPALDPLFPGIPNAEWIQECELNGEKVYSPKRERLLTMPCEWGTDQGLPATLVSVPLSAFCYGWCQNSTVTMSLTKAPGQ